MHNIKGIKKNICVEHFTYLELPHQRVSDLCIRTCHVRIRMLTNLDIQLAKRIRMHTSFSRLPHLHKLANCYSMEYCDIKAMCSLRQQQEGEGYCCTPSFV